METTVEEKVKLEHYLGRVCPYCHARAVRGHEDNGLRGWERAYLCGNCREQWDAENYAPDNEGG